MPFGYRFGRKISFHMYIIFPSLLLALCSIHSAARRALLGGLCAIYKFTNLHKKPLNVERLNFFPPWRDASFLSARLAAGQAGGLHPLLFLEAGFGGVFSPFSN